MRPIFCGNLDYEARQSDVERIFRRYGTVDRVDIKSVLKEQYMYTLCPHAPERGREIFVSCKKCGLDLVFFHFRRISQLRHCSNAVRITENVHAPSGWTDPLLSFSGFAFVYMDDERDAEDAIRRLDGMEFGRKGHRLRVEWTKQDRGTRGPGNSRKPPVNAKPSKTLFVINFDPIHTRTRDLERHFDKYGKISNIRIRRNFAFIHYESQEDATRALDATNMSKLMDRVISVEYAIRDDDERRNGYSPDRRARDKSPGRRSYDRGHSPSPYRRDRGSPDYGHGSKPHSRAEPRESPSYDRTESPIKERDHSRSPRPRGRS